MEQQILKILNRFTDLYRLIKEREIKSKLPWKGGIYLPTDAIPLEERVKGLERVLHIYKNEWRQKYSPQLRELRTRFAGSDRCFIIGNGPSLKETNLDLLKEEVTFGVNSVFLIFPETDFRRTSNNGK